MFPTVANTCVSILKISLQTLTPVPFVQTASKLFPISTHNVFILDKAFFADSITPLPFASQDCFIGSKKVANFSFISEIIPCDFSSSSVGAIRLAPLPPDPESFSVILFVSSKENVCAADAAEP